MKNKTFLRVLVLLVLIATAVVSPARAWGVPPDIDARYAGSVRVRVKRLSTDAHHTVYVRKCAGGYTGQCDAWQRLGTLAENVTEFNTNLQVLSNDYVDLKVDSDYLPSDWNPVVYSSDRARNPRPDENPPGPRVVAPHGSSGELCGNAPAMSIADLLASSYYWLSSSCWEDWVDFDYNDLAFVVDYVLGSIPRSVGVHIRNRQGTPLARSIGGSEVEVAMWWAWFAQTQTWGNLPDGTHSLLTPTSVYNYQGGYVQPNAGEVVLGITPVPDGGWEYTESGKTSYNWYYDTWPQAERRDVHFVLGTHTPTPTNTPTPTPTPTATATPTPTPTPIPTVITLQRDWAWLVWYGARPPVGSATQALRGQVTGPVIPVGTQVGLYIFPPNPDGSPCNIAQGCPYSTYVVSTISNGYFSLDASGASDPDFGTTRQGIWQARAQVPGAVSNVVNWDVEWNRSHISH